MNHPPRWTARTIAVTFALVAGCASPSASAPSSTADPAPRSNTPVSADAPTVGSTATAPSSAGAATTPGAPDAPVATLVSGSDRVVGEVGAFTFGSHTDSAPWLPAQALEPIAVPAGSELSVELDDRATVGDWTARLAAASDPSADDVAGLASGSGSPIVFPAPPAGEWVVSVAITYGDGAGDGAYYWRLVVE